MYYEYWGLQKAPFDNVPDPTMYAECHETMERAIAETVFAIEEGEDCISVIVGDVGLGKTLSIRVILDSLDHEKYKIALVTNPGLTFVQLLKEIIGQITGTQCAESKKVNLLEIFNKLLFGTMDEEKKILIFIDEANVITPKNLENLRLLTNMQDDQRNLFTMVLVGQLELAQRLELPKFANLFQRIGTYNRIERIQTKELVKTYVETRLKHAGGIKNIFTEDAFSIIWEHSDCGVPRLINKICKLSLKAGETNGFNEIDGGVVHQIGARFQKISGPADPKRKPRKMPMEEITHKPIEETGPVPEESDSLDLQTPFGEEVEKTGVVLEETEREPVLEESDSLNLQTPFSEDKEEETGPVLKESDSLDLQTPFSEDKEEETVPVLEESDSPDLQTPFSEDKEEEETVPVLEESDSLDLQTPFSEDKEEEETGPVLEESDSLDLQTPFSEDEEETVPVLEKADSSELPTYPEESPSAIEEGIDEIKIGENKVTVNLPSDFIEKAKASDQDDLAKMAGVMAAQTMKENPQLTESLVADPVPIWDEIKNFILRKIGKVKK